MIIYPINPNKPLSSEGTTTTDASIDSKADKKAVAQIAHDTAEVSTMAEILSFTAPAETQRLEAIKAAIADGQYVVDAKAIAEKLFPMFYPHYE